MTFDRPFWQGVTPNNPSTARLYPWRWIAIVFLIWSLIVAKPALGQGGGALDISAFDTIKTAYVTVDGHLLFQVSAAGQVSAAKRAQGISEILEESLEKSLVTQKPLFINLVQQSSDVWMTVNGRYLLTVLSNDVMLGTPPIEQGYVWREAIDDAFLRYREERTPAYRLRALKLSGGILMIAILLQSLFVWGTRWSRRKRVQSNATMQGSLLLLGLTLSQGVLWLGTIGTIANLFPLSRRWLFLLYSLLTSFFRAEFLHLGERGISLNQLFTVALLAIVVWFLIRRFTLLLRSHILTLAGVDLTLQESIASFTQYGLLALGLLIVFSLVGVDLGALALLFGAFGVGIGFGLQNIAKDFISGIIMTFERPVKVGELIQVGEFQGLVLRIGPRVTAISHIDRHIMLVPNSRFIDEIVLNWNRSNLTRVKVYVDVAYGSDIEFVKKVMLEAIQIPHPDILRHPPAKVKFREFRENALNFRVVVFIRDPLKQPKVRAEILDRLARAFEMYQIHVPVVQRDLNLKIPYLDQVAPVWLRQQLSPQEWEDLQTSKIPPVLPEPKIQAEYDWKAIVEKMRGSDGVDIRDRRFSFRVYRQCFLGSDAVNWLMKQEQATREEAILMGQLMVEQDLIHHVLDEHGFEDSPLFYRFRADENQDLSMNVDVDKDYGMEEDDRGDPANENNGMEFDS
jgi:small-conductance mechanosensitive channel